jgi:hypothetical protein
MAVFLIFIWMFIGLGVGSIVQQFVTLRLSKPLTWEEGNLHRVYRVRDDRATRDPFIIGHFAALLVTLAVFGLLLVAIGLVYLPVVLQ